MDFFKKASASLGGTDGQSDLLKQAQGFLSGHQQAAESHATAGTQAKPAETAAAPTAAEKKGYGEVYSSAQTLYQGIQDKLGGKADVDDHKLAVAAEDVLKAAESSGFLGKDNQYSDYFKKAETYLHNYGSKDASAPAAAKQPEDKPAS